MSPFGRKSPPPNPPPFPNPYDAAQEKMLQKLAELQAAANTTATFNTSARFNFPNLPAHVSVAAAVPEPTPTAALPVVAGPVVAIRAWNVVTEASELCLSAVGIGTVIWPAGAPFHALCRQNTSQQQLYAAMMQNMLRRDLHSGRVPTPVAYPRLKVQPWQAVGNPQHAAPCATCQCGIWAVKDVAHLAEFRSVVIGRVALWGRLIEQDKGYRAEYAYPIAFWRRARPMPGFPVAQRDTERLEKLAWAYGVPIEDGLSTR